MTQEMPREIMVYGEPEREVQVDVEPYHPCSVPYVPKSIADKLAEALERLIDSAAEGHYGHLSPDAYLAQDKARGDARAALKAYRDGV